MKRSHSLVLLMIFTMSLAFSAPSGLVINEVASVGAYEYVELKNYAEAPFVSDGTWQLRDSREGVLDTDGAITIDSGVRIPAGGILLYAPYKTSVLSNEIPEGIPEEAQAVRSFALGSIDSISLTHAGELIDSWSWDTGVNPMGRDPDDPSQVLIDGLMPTPGQENEYDQYLGYESPLVINEVCTRGLDYIEILNRSQEDVTFEQGKWTIHDLGRGDRFIFPDGYTLKSGQLAVVYPDVLRLPLSAPKNAIPSLQGRRFGLGERDMVFLRYGEAIADSIRWYEHVASMGRYPDGSDDWDSALLMTPGSNNRR